MTSASASARGHEQDGPAKSGYGVSLLGGIVGPFVFGPVVAAVMVAAGMGMEILVYGPVVAGPIGIALGIWAALALFKREAPVLTGLISLAVTAVAFVAVWGLSRVVDYGWPFIIPQFIVPIASRWIALSVRRRQAETDQLDHFTP
jgi:hypothetical protein